MKRFFTKTGIWLLAAAATIAVVLCVVSALSSGTGLLHNALGVIASPFRAAGSAVAGWVGGISQRFEDVETLQQENDEITLSMDIGQARPEWDRQVLQKIGFSRCQIDKEVGQRLLGALDLTTAPMFGIIARK